MATRRQPRVVPALSAADLLLVHLDSTGTHIQAAAGDTVRLLPAPLAAATILLCQQGLRQPHNLLRKSILLGRHQRTMSVSLNITFIATALISLKSPAP